MDSKKPTKQKPTNQTKNKQNSPSLKFTLTGEGPYFRTDEKSVLWVYWIQLQFERS